MDCVHEYEAHRSLSALVGLPARKLGGRGLEDRFCIPKTARSTRQAQSLLKSSKPTMIFVIRRSSIQKIEQASAGEKLSGEVGAVAASGGEAVVIEVVDDLGLAVVETREGQRAAAGREGEAGVQFGEGRETGLAVGEDEFEFAGVDGGAGGEGPLGEVGVIVGEEEVGQGDGVGAGVVEFKPGGALAGAVGRGKVWWGLWRAADRVRRPCVYRSFGRERLMLAPGCCVFGI